MDILKSSLELHRLGLALLWLKPKSKMPVKSAWTTGPRERWKDLKENYKKGYNVGVRLGEVSTLNGKSLAVIDCDVKSTSTKHQKELEEFLKSIGVDYRKLPTVLSGRGNGSKHIYCLVDKKTQGRKLGKSKEKIKVMMPSVAPSVKDREALSEKDIKKGYRSRAAWEIDLMVEGRQVVLPPSIHPDSGKPYTWERPLALNRLKELDFSHVAETSQVSREVDQDIELKKIDLDKTSLTKKTKAMIVDGNGVEDRSAGLMSAALAMFATGMSRSEVVSVLTDKDFYLGQVAYSHTKNNSRKGAARWVQRYTVNRAEKIIKDERMIEDKPDNRTISKEEQKKQIEELCSWTDSLERFPSGVNIGRPKTTLANFLLTFDNELPKFLGRNMLKYREEFLTDTPWGAQKGELLEDEDIPYIKLLLEKEVRMPTVPNETLFDAISYTATENAFDPLREYLEGLKWDRKPRLNTWLKDYCKARGNKEYLAAIGRKFILAMVYRALEPGCKFDHVLILEGVQGARKSTMARVLAGGFFTDTDIKFGNKDTIQLLQGCWIVELGELAAMNRAEVEEMKKFVTQTHDEIRLPYARLPKKFPRRFVIIGTTNKGSNGEGYLKDTTGNRRYWPVHCEGQLDTDGLEMVRDQLFAEAMHLYLMGEEKIYIDTEELKQLAEDAQQQREIEDPVVKEIRRLVPQLMKLKEGITTYELYQKLHPLVSRIPENWELTRYGTALRKLGFVCRRTREGNLRERRYFIGDENIKKPKKVQKIKSKIDPKYR